MYVVHSDFSIGSHLDKVFVSRRFFSCVSNCEIKCFCLSDHDLGYLSFRLGNLCPRGPGLWKFNNSLLNDTAFSDHISEGTNDLIACIEHFPSVKSW